MSDTTTTDEDDNGNDNDRRRKALWTTAVVILLALVCVSIVAAQAGTVSDSDDFEDGNIDGWEGPAASISETSAEGNYSLRQDDGYGSDGPTPVQWDSGPTLALDEEFTIQGTSYSSQGDGSYQTRVGLINENDNGAMLVFSAQDDQTILTDIGAGYDASESPSVSGDYDDTWVRWEIYSAGNGTIEAKVWEAGEIEPEEFQMSRSFDAVTSPVGLNAGNVEDGDRYVLLDSVSVEGTVAGTGDSSLNIDTSNLIQHGDTRTYGVDELRPQPGGVNSSVDVTENATVTSENPDVLSVDSENNTLTATENTSVAEVVRVNASYNGSTAYKDVTVAEPTVENLEIIPGIWRFTALVGDTTVQVLLLGTFVGIVGTRGASSFAGLSLMEMAMVMGFLGGWVELGMVLASTFVAVFIGLNLAANIDYSVRR